MLKLFKKIDIYLDKKVPVLILLLSLILLRIPNFFEPYWYGDEAIYLTVGQGIKYGRSLYEGIVDHKTPIIYYLATVPSQIWFRVLNLAWMGVSTLLFYRLAKKILKNKKSAFIGSFIFVLLTTLPFLEGNIPNGELFVIGFVLAGVNLLLNSSYFNWLNNKKEIKNNDHLQLFAAGIFFGLAILTKVPALLDLAAFLTIGWFYLANCFLFKQKQFFKAFKTIFLQFVFLGLGVLTPIILSILYFILLGVGKDYLQYGLLYNFRYTQSWQVAIEPAWLLTLFGLKAKLGMLVAFFLLLTVLGKKLSRQFKFMLSWLVLSLFATTLSNRPYPHYYQQLVPAFTLLLTYVLTNANQLLKQGKGRIKILIESGAFLLIFIFIFKLSIVLNFHPYPTFSYYQKFYQYSTGKISMNDYYQWFNPLTQDTYQVAQFVRDEQQREIFIWGTNPMLYALSKSIPAGKFTVSFHIKDVKAYDETMSSIKKVKPNIIVIMKNEAGDFPEFYQYLNNNYQLEKEYQYMDLYLKNNYVKQN